VLEPKVWWKELSTDYADIKESDVIEAPPRQNNTIHEITRSNTKRKQHERASGLVREGDKEILK
jgi:hypothetical protein